ncbi:MAG: M48 family metallopeptidase [Sinomicrobium sp.]|nr:M48 family metallopeptidase [Sinomicrobium sp.]
MKYVGLQQQISANNTKSVLLLLSFPLLLLFTVWIVFFFLPSEAALQTSRVTFANEKFTTALPYVLVATGLWFLIAWFSHSAIIKAATRSVSLSRKDNKRVYNLVENLCISQGMKIPKINIIASDALNAFASGINDQTYAITLTMGIIETLNDDELEGVIAHELAHIRNRDVRLLIISIIFVGIFSFALNAALRSSYYGGNRKKDGRLLLIIFIVSAIAYLLSVLFKLSLSRKREYMADAAGAAMTRKPWALAGALRKISGNHQINIIKNKDVASLFIHYKPLKSSAISHIFATHPPIEKRIQLLEQF